jgi:hypothetical protein
MGDIADIELEDVQDVQLKVDARLIHSLHSFRLLRAPVSDGTQLT